jgi:hypothetical protein
MLQYFYMDPAGPTTETPEVASQTQTAPEASNEAPKSATKNNSWITILAMALFILSTLSIVAFLYYQNQQLKAMLTDYQTPASGTPTALPTISPTPEVTPSTSGSPTASSEATSSPTPTMSPTASPTN